MISEQGRLPIRGGICEGHVIMFESADYVGAAVNVAAGLCAWAEPGQLPQLRQFGLVEANNPTPMAGERFAESQYGPR